MSLAPLGALRSSSGCELLTRAHRAMGPAEPYEQLITVTELARMLSVDRTSIKRWIFAGKLPVVTTPGGHYRIRMSTVRETFDL